MTFNFNLFLVLMILYRIQQIKSECVVPLKNLNNDPIFLQTIGSEKVFVPSTGLSFKFGKHSAITAYCQSGFENIRGTGSRYNQDMIPIQTNTLTLHCANGETYFNEKYRLLGNIVCKSSAKSEVYEIPIRTECECNQKYYSMGMSINNDSTDIRSANVCFDLDNMNIKFVHYVSKAETLVISHKNNFEKNNRLAMLSSPRISSEAPSEVFFLSEIEANGLIRAIIGSQADLIQYSYEEFYQVDDFLGQIQEPMENVKTLNRFLGWNNLVRGNWKNFRNLLTSRSKEFTYDVYMGTSGVVSAVTENACDSIKELHLNGLTKRLSVPEYVWSYLKSRSDETDEFVVIGMNSPYKEIGHLNGTALCEDMCHEVDWLAPLEKFRKKHFFGYLFCCRKNQVKHILDGFPILKLKSKKPQVPLLSATEEPENTIDSYSDLED